jgi:1-acyl-sn-glycerol-3-phosphate acyltransferase
MDKQTLWTRRALRGLGWCVLRVLTRFTLTGRENLKVDGPVIYAANHASTFDALLLITLLPKDTVFVGPGDFKLLWPANWIVKHAGLIPMKRGGVDRDGLKHMLDILKSGGSLAMFPEGGTWEKPSDDVKSGVSYLSQASGAQIVPMGFGGTYQVWSAIFRLHRPRIDVRIAPALPPVTVSEDRKRRQDDLQAAAVDLMYRIYDLLPQATQARYDDLKRVQFKGALKLDHAAVQLPDVSFDALAELVSKPNLFSPLHRNAKLPIQPFVHPGRWYPSSEMRIAADALFQAFSTGDFEHYLDYRLGDRKTSEIRSALGAIRDIMESNPNTRVMFVTDQSRS